MWRLLVVLPFVVGYPQDKKDDKKSPSAKVYDKVVDSVVGIMSRLPLGDASGTGVVIDEEGYILTSSTIITEGTEKFRVWTHGPRRYDFEKEIEISKGVKVKEVEIVGVSFEEEIAVVKINKPRQKLKAIKFADSGKAKVGDVVYALGNAGMMTKSIIDNDQATFQMGLLSGYYNIRDTKQSATYKGYMFETTALFNPKMEGGPLVNTQGEMIGMLTPNYSPHRFVGHAIPVNVFKKKIRLLIEEYKKRSTTSIKNNEADGYSGMELADKNGKVVISKVDPDSPADRKGLRVGDVVLKIGGKDIKAASDFNDYMKGLKVGAVLRFVVEIDGQKEEIQFSLEEKK